MSSPVKHLVLIADNCPGQNKNNTVIKYFQWLVEAGCTLKATLLFLIKGHTKNICDRHFNLLKNALRNKNIYDEKGLDAALTEKNKKYISLMRLEYGTDKWRDFSKFLDEYYMDCPPKTITPNHIYTFGVNGSKTLYLRQTYRDGEGIIKDLIPTRRSKQAAKNLSAEERVENIKKCMQVWMSFILQVLQ